MQFSHVKEISLYSIVYLYAVDIPPEECNTSAAHNNSDWRGMLWRRVKRGR